MTNKVAGRKAKIILDRDMCKGCGYCVEACPKGVLVMEKASFNAAGFLPAVAEKPSECTGCALCARMCPDIAIEIWVEE